MRRDVVSYSVAGSHREEEMKEALYARVKAFIKEFAFVGRYVRLGSLDKRPVVQRIDLDLLDRKGWTDVWISRNRYAGFRDIRFLLIGANGEELRRVRQLNVVRPAFRLLDMNTWFCQDVEGETVYEAIQQLDDPDQVHYVLEVKDLWGGARGKGSFGDPDFGVEVILHKVPSGRSFSNWLVQIRDVADNEFRGELAKVNRV